MKEDLLQLDLTYEGDTVVPTEMLAEPEKWFSRPIEERNLIIEELSEFFYGDKDDVNGSFNVDLNDPEVIG
ncbi:hypothetical protein Emtol_0335 (plasmid) [Emticicia oligotrophica DSM 17448]|uniref:Uncharacterized protein n=1 Tax=Emticicia oligotrophica (strain DSM 17448 / CIP 109782 / MTCC 6937 / GPTSA100-15) TaxID=929562 RepID=A0ABM5N811_EMTOG|nr:hypothetical protein [Emticicia oligotrophica]AFK05602.1 hypothetical protein Emtol_0335 [Emticicia oligotrophica DSM 17448]